MDIRLGALKMYRQHLVAQYADRCAYWALKDISADVMAQTLTITTDGADQVPWFLFCGEGSVCIYTCIYIYIYIYTHILYVFFLSRP